MWQFHFLLISLINQYKILFVCVCNNDNNNTCRIANFAFLEDHRVKIKENKKRDNYLEN